jgi:hypothetical protein
MGEKRNAYRILVGLFQLRNKISETTYFFVPKLRVPETPAFDLGRHCILYLKKELLVSPL